MQSDNTLLEYIKQHEYFVDLPVEQQEVIFQHAKLSHINKGECLVQEGENSTKLYLIISGLVSVYKTSKLEENHKIKTIAPGKSVGELQLIEKKPSAASVIASKDSSFVEINLHALENDPSYLHMKGNVMHNIAKRLAHRLRYINQLSADTLQDKLEMSELMVDSARIFANIIGMASIYTLCLQFFYYIINTFMSGETVIFSAAMLIILGLFTLYIMYKSKLNYADFGITLINYKQAIFNGLKTSIYVIFAATIFKYFAITYVDKYQHLQLFDPVLALRPGNFTLSIYISSLIIYIIMVPIQELIVRCGIQVSLYRLFRGSELKRNTLAIIISNLLFGMFHTHLNTTFAFVALLTGLYWGWLFSKYKNLITVSVSHITIGIWILFIISLHSGAY